jgi:hypothetical protein
MVRNPRMSDSMRAAAASWSGFRDMAAMRMGNIGLVHDTSGG